MIKILFKIILFLFVIPCFSQDEVTQFVYFDVNEYELKDAQENILCGFMEQIDSSNIKSVHIIGYCDDLGTKASNYRLSEKRAAFVEKLILKSGLNPKKLTVLKGNGEIIIPKNSVSDVDEARLKNRRVEIVVEKTKNTAFFLGIPRLYSEIKATNKTGDRIYLQNIQFKSGSSILNEHSKKILDKLSVFLVNNPYMEFEIQGHVCCTPDYTDAIDRDSKEPKLSYNRARSVYRYLLTKRIKASRMIFNGYGNRFPIKGKSEDLDKRVELVITKC